MFLGIDVQYFHKNDLANIKYFVQVFNLIIHFKG